MRRFLDSLVAFVLWHRRVLGALLAAGSVLLVAHTLATPRLTVPVVTVAAKVAPGTVLSAADLALAQLPPEAVPAGSLDRLEDAVGATAAVELAEGTTLQPGLLGRSGNASPDTTTVPVQVADDAIRALLQPGDLVSLVTVSEAGTEVAASGVRVVSLPPSPDEGALALGSTASSVVLVDVPREVAASIAVLGQSGQLSVILGSA